MTEDPQVAAARVEVERRRSRLMATAHQLQDRLSPRTLARNTWEGTKEKGADLVEDAVDGVRSHPLAAGGVVAAITMFLAREPLMDLAGKLVDGAKAKAKTKAKTRTRPRTPQKVKTEATE